MIMIKSTTTKVLGGGHKAECAAKINHLRRLAGRGSLPGTVVLAVRGVLTFEEGTQSKAEHAHLDYAQNSGSVTCRPNISTKGLASPPAAPRP